MQIRENVFIFFLIREWNSALSNNNNNKKKNRHLKVASAYR